ncbi:MAG: P1 family peptidase [Bacillota bacterium]|nr:P1 family peptidase [Bacillota bacterium]
MEKIAIHEIPGFSFGQVQDLAGGTGCTVVLCPAGAVTGVDVRGGSPGTRDTDALDPLCNREVVHSVVLTGGSAFGLDAAGGVMKKLEEEGVGRDVMVTVVPNVCAAVLFDLKFGDKNARPDQAMGYAACEKALEGGPFQEGNFGAGTGCTVGKIRGPQFAMKGGVGACAFRQGDLMVGAVVACNAMGDVLEQGEIIAGSRNEENTGFAGSEDWLIANGRWQKDIFSGKFVGENTVIGCVVTNAALNKNQANKLAAVAQNGIARAVRPANATFDGDAMFAMCHGTVPADPDAVGSMAARAVEEAIVRSVKLAESLHGKPALRDLPFGKKGI